MQLEQYVNSKPRKLAPLMGFPGTTITKTTIRENLHDSTKQFHTIMALYEKYKPDFVFPMMDLTVECEAIGASVRFPEQESASIEGKLVQTPADILNLKIPELGGDNRLPVFIETLEQLVKNLPPTVMKAGYIMGPFSVAGRLMGASELALNIILEPQMTHELLQYIQAVLQKYLRGLLQAKPDQIWILEPTASLISPQQAAEFSDNYIRPLIATIRQAGAGVVLHNCGQIMHLLDGYSHLGLDGLSVGSCVNIKEVRERVTKSMVVFGNLDPSQVFNLSTPDQVRTATIEMLKAMQDTVNYVPGTGCDLPPTVPHANITAFIKAVREGE